MAMRVEEPMGRRITARVMFAVAIALLMICVTSDAASPPSGPATGATSISSGGVPGLAFVSQDRWGGLPVTLILATFGLAFGFPLGILVALGRRSKLPAIHSLCVLYVELIRGVPLISLLFMASVMFPLFMPDGVNIDKLLRAQIAIVLYAGAYLAEVIRGGLQAVPRGQYEAAEALGLSY